MKVLFVIHNLQGGGAQKVLVNLVNNMDKDLFDITVLVLFGGGINRQFLNEDINYIEGFPYAFRGNQALCKLFSPERLFNFFIKDCYDIVVSYLEGITARVVSGCTNPNTKLVSWIHVQRHSLENLSTPFRNSEEAKACYNRFDQTVCVSKYVHDNFCSLLDFKKPCEVLYNTVESSKILRLSKEKALELIDDNKIRLVAVGTLKYSKGYDRLLKIVQKIYYKFQNIHLYILGIGPLEQEITKYIEQHNLNDVVSLLGYQINPYKYISKCDLFVCASREEGFSTAATEALIVGTPVCTVNVSGMKEMLGENNDYGVVTENSEEALQQGIEQLLQNPEMLSYYKKKAEMRGQDFQTDKTVKNVENMLLKIYGENK